MAILLLFVPDAPGALGTYIEKTCRTVPYCCTVLMIHVEGLGVLCFIAFCSFCWLFCVWLSAPSCRRVASLKGEQYVLIVLFKLRERAIQQHHRYHWCVPERLYVTPLHVVPLKILSTPLGVEVPRDHDT